MADDPRSDPFPMGQFGGQIISRPMSELADLVAMRDEQLSDDDIGDLSDLDEIEDLFADDEQEAEDAFEEGQHPRDAHGEFSSTEKEAWARLERATEKAREHDAKHHHKHHHQGITSIGAALEYGGDAEFNEADHPRGQPENAGEFASGGGSGGGGGASTGEHGKTYAAGVKASGMAKAVAQKNEWRKQAPDTVEAVVAAAPKNQETLAKVAEGISRQLGAPLKNPGAKSEQRIRDKIGRGKSPQQISDAVRLGFDADTPEKADAIVKELAKHFEVSDEGWGRTVTGYIDRKVMVRFDDGMIGEVQLWPPGVRHLKAEKAHPLYQKWQETPPGPAKAALMAAQVGLFTTFAEHLPAMWHGINFSPTI